MATYTVILTSGTLNLRATPSTSGTILTTIPNYATVTGVLIIPYASETDMADGMTWRSVEYNGKKGWVASQYLTAGNVPAPIVPPQANGILNPTTDINPQNQTGMFTLTDEMKKKLKIGAIIIGVLGAGFAIYKATSKKSTQAALPENGTVAALSGVPRRKKRKKSKKTLKTNKRVNLN